MVEKVLLVLGRALEAMARAFMCDQCTMGTRKPDASLNPNPLIVVSTYKTHYILADEAWVLCSE